MDGASKFVKGDAIIGIIITFINIIGGILIGLLGAGGKVMTFDEVISVYVLATVGNGLCSQISALLISTATGITVTRAATKESFGQDVARQLFNQTMVFYILAGMLALLSLVPGLPTFVILVIAAGVAFFGYYRSKNEKKKQQEEVRTPRRSPRPKSASRKASPPF